MLRKGPPSHTVTKNYINYNFPPTSAPTLNPSTSQNTVSTTASQHILAHNSSNVFLQL